ncbi:bifunctional sugar phosphate isomerase/epimerase/4-hydroxyphenylpyruvate dioxygenase family protein [Aeromicrobium sp. CTD01-1L150]|uniref:bifunctional sugar phosphate isomerase/epimerase/4-hydroxyphenylpyruvate dioxygenase family protein n=1 Tax=Aeromicrobium sp. CTD01-1L150 TaxID=3341830 RepID=UPI0035BFB747
MKASVATVCLSGGLVEKLHACAEAGFDAVEVFEPDLVAAPESPEEIRALAQRLGLTLSMYQPMRDVEGVDEHAFEDVLRRAAAKFALMQRLGIDLVLCCSNVATATIDDDEVSAGQLRRLGDLAQRYGIRIAYEALAWGRFVDDYRRAWRIVESVDHPSVGTCLDSFHILSRGDDPSEIERIPGEKIFFLQVADAPALTMDVLSWSRHHRLFPGEGAFDLPAFVGHAVRAGYRGPLSLEVFNDTFRQTDVRRTAHHARRSLRWLEDAVARRVEIPQEADLRSVAAPTPPTGFDFVEVKAEDTAEVELMLTQLGFTCRGKHRTKAVTLYTAGPARVVLNEQHARELRPHLASVGLQVEDPVETSRRARDLAVPLTHRRTYATEQPLEAVVAPDGTQIHWSGRPADDEEPTWVQEFLHGEQPHGEYIVAIDHVNLAQPWQVMEEAKLFHSAVLGLQAGEANQVAGPRGFVRSQVMRTADGAVRLPLNVRPAIESDAVSAQAPQHVAFRCSDVVALARRARERGLQFLPVPDNYYDDLVARFALEETFIESLRELGILYDRDGSGEYLHFYTRTVGELFWEFVERRDRYDGYGAANASVRLSAQSRS